VKARAVAALVPLLAALVLAVASIDRPLVPRDVECVNSGLLVAKPCPLTPTLWIRWKIEELRYAFLGE